MTDDCGLRDWYSNHCQGTVFRFYDTLEKGQKQNLLTQAESIDVEFVNTLFRNKSRLESAMINNSQSNVQPLENVYKLNRDDASKWTQLGYHEIAEGRACVLLLAGGQGTRLGTDDPKGVYNIELPSQKSLYQIQAERLLKLRHLVAQEMGKNVADIVIPWYIMTSFATEVKTKQYFEEHNYFGLDKKDVLFFNQNLFPCVSLDGEILLSSKHEISVAPNGNGGIWSALKREGILEDMERRNIRWICSYPVDNILVKICDPLFIGFCTEKDVEVACKVVPKEYPEEKVGVLGTRDNKPVVIEYSEIDSEKAKARHPITNDWLFNASHIVLNNFEIGFVKRITDGMLDKLPYHFAKKAIPCLNEQGETVTREGYKFELFVFDVFEFADERRFFALEVKRDEEFAPLKNGNDSEVDNPNTCRTKLSELHKRYIEEAGGRFKDRTAGLCEISPLVSYEGEGLKELVEGQVLELPLYISRPSEEKVKGYPK